ncbi:hypothetical protein DY000_02014712 [Brassica cretica]|uniref:Uncharacterized protein n=1 Tax=Brassica cretica TaxID=69181 RepID=A0ABQ7D5M2_BRACR|nr:hypothetical protein DY000_02014712 [Brassica cretica]
MCCGCSSERPRKLKKTLRECFHQVREKMRQRITLKKKSDPGKFVVPCLIGGIDYPIFYCDHEANVESETESLIATQPKASIDKMSGAPINRTLEASIDNDHRKMSAMETDEYDEDYKEEATIEYRGLAMEES